MKSYRTAAFDVAYARLPARVVQQANAAYALWLRDPRHKGLAFKQIADRPSYYSIRVGLRWRAVA